MQLAKHIVVFEAHGLPLVGNLHTGSLIGLTREGLALCRRLQQREVAAHEVPEGCQELMRHLAAGGYLSGAETKEANAAPHGQRGAVSSAYLHVTQRCNLSCAFCYSEDAQRNTLPDPSLDELNHALDTIAAQRARRVVISGGEPFLRDDLPRVAQHAKDVGVQEIVVLTNGLLCTRERLQPLAGLVDCLGVAFDGYDGGRTPHLRGQSVFEPALRAVQTALACGIAARILPTIHARNVCDLPRYRALADEQGASLSYSLLTATTKALGDLSLSEEQLHDLAMYALHEQLALDSDLVSGPGLAARCSCGVGTRTLSVAAGGSVYPCHMLHDPRLALGNAFTDDDATLAERLLEGPTAQLCVDQVESCNTCNVRYLCGGGCRARAFYDTGALDAPDPYCALYRTYYEGVASSLAVRYAAQMQ